MKKNHYYLKDKKAMIYKKKNVAEPGDMPSLKYVPVNKTDLWCYSTQLSEMLIFQAKAYGSEESRMFVFNPVDVELYDLIKYREVWYSVTRVDTNDDYNSDVFVYVKKCKDSEIPDESSILSA